MNLNGLNVESKLFPNLDLQVMDGGLPIDEDGIEELLCLPQLSAGSILRGVDIHKPDLDIAWVITFNLFTCKESSPDGFQLLKVSSGLLMQRWLLAARSNVLQPCLPWHDIICI